MITTFPILPVLAGAHWLIPELTPFPDASQDSVECCGPQAEGIECEDKTKNRRAPDLSILITAYSCFQLCQALLKFCNLGGERR